MKVKWSAPVVLALCAALALSGCIDSATKITVRNDGSGTIEKTVVLSTKLVSLIAGMGMGGDAASIEAGMLSEKSLKAEASRMGAEVSFVSAQKLTTPKGNGYRAVYSFKDIGKVKIDESPAADVSMPQGAAAASGGSATPELLTFRFAKGSPATLTIVAPPVESSRAAPARSSQTSPEDAQKMLESMRPLYADLRIALSVEVQGTITQTNAAFVDGSTVTLMELDFGKILADEAVWKKLASTQADSIKQVQDVLKAMPGVRLETQPTVSVSFR